VLPDEAVLQALHALDRGALHQNHILDAGVRHPRPVADARVGTDEGPLHDRPLSYHRRAPDPAADDLGARRYAHPAFHNAVDDFALDPALQVLVEDDRVRGEDVVLLARVEPPGVEDLCAYPEAHVDHRLDRVRYLELAAPGRLYPLYGLVDPGGEDVGADDREVARRVLRLLNHPEDAPLRGEGCDPEALGLRDLLEQDEAVQLFVAEAPDEPGDPPPLQVVPEAHHEVRIPEERVGGPDCVCEAERLLWDVLHREAPLGSVLHVILHVLPGLRGDYYAGFPYPRLDHLVEDVAEDRTVSHWDELLRYGESEGAEARAFAAREDEGFHLEGFLQTQL